MGLDKNRFENLAEFGGELICSICMDIFDEAYMLTTCGHTFCKICIETWIEERRNCLNCLLNVGYYRELVAAPVPLKNIMSKLCIHCDYEEMGCEVV
ncbi:dentin sialophosphoprotein-like protein, partial [Leptotrombidium deliense]